LTTFEFRLPRLQADVAHELAVLGVFVLDGFIEVLGRLDREGVTSRAMMSAASPGGNGTLIRTDRTG
jgi:hypothetical protein